MCQELGTKNRAMNKTPYTYRISVLVLELDNKDTQEKNIIYKS